MTLPETNPSLLVRLNNPANEQAWEEFVELYRPALLTFAIRKGLQVDDAEDLAQGVLLSVSQALEGWEVDANRASFRTWLFTVANRKVIDAIRLRARLAVSGGTKVQEQLNEHAEREEDSRILRLEVRRQLFFKAAEKVKNEFPAESWSGFWMMAIDGKSASEVANAFQKSVGAVYAAKGRIMRRLSERIREMGEGTEE